MGLLGFSHRTSLGELGKLGPVANPKLGLGFDSLAPEPSESERGGGRGVGRRAEEGVEEEAGGSDGSDMEVIEK